MSYRSGNNLSEECGVNFAFHVSWIFFFHLNLVDDADVFNVLYMHCCTQYKESILIAMSKSVYRINDVFFFFVLLSSSSPMNGRVVVHASTLCFFFHSFIFLFLLLLLYCCTNFFFFTYLISLASSNPIMIYS